MNRGYVKLWRKSLDAGWIKNHKLWAFWSYCLMKASNRDYDAIVGLQVVKLSPGHFICGRKKAAAETGLTEREIRTIMTSLINCGNLTIKTTNKFSIISIVNWTIYQSDNSESDQQNDQPETNKGPHTNIKALKNKKTFTSDSVEYGLAELLLKKIRSRLPGFKEPNLQSWAKDIDMMIHIDNRELSEIRGVIEWSQKDPFWQSNILSAGKLRKQFDQLKAKMKSAGALSVIKKAESHRPGAVECTQCGRRIIVKSDITEAGCVYCEAKI